METQENQKKIEVEPRARVLIVDCQPVSKQNVAISKKLFDQSGEKIKDFGNLAVTSVKAPSSEEEPTATGREEKANMFFPESPEDFTAIVITGSPFSAYPRDKEGRLFVAQWKRELIEFINSARKHNKPVLGICFGAQIIAEGLGGKVGRMKTKDGQEVWETGWGEIKRSPDSYNDPIMKDLPDTFIAPQNHKDVITGLPEGAVLLAENQYGVQGFRLENIWGFEFHPERNPEKVEENLSRQSEEMKRYGLDPDKIRELGKGYSPIVGKIFSNFLNLAWSNVQ